MVQSREFRDYTEDLDREFKSIPNKPKTKASSRNKQVRVQQRLRQCKCGREFSPKCKSHKICPHCYYGGDVTKEYLKFF